MDLSDVTPEALSGILSSLTEEDTENITRLASERFSAQSGKQSEYGHGI